MLAALGYLFLRMPTAYLPEEDQGILLAQVMLPIGSTLEQTQRTLDEIKDYFDPDEKEVVESLLRVAGIGFSARAQTNAMFWIKLKDRQLPQQGPQRAKATAARATGTLMKLRNSILFVFPPPTVVEPSNARGFDFQLMDRGDLGHTALMYTPNQLLETASQEQRLVAVRPNGMEDVPEYRIEVDWEGAGSLGLSISSIYNTISTAFGGAYVNDFIQGGRVKRVYVQAHTPYRMLPGNLERLYERNTLGRMVPFSSFCIRPLDLRLRPSGETKRISIHEYLGRGGSRKEFRGGHASNARDSLRTSKRRRS